MPNWMGRYHSLMEALVLHGNTSARYINTKHEYAQDIFLTFQEGQVLEYIIEHESDDDSMIRISERLGIPQSSFSKYTKVLCGYDLIAKYQMVNNRKNIILKPTEKGKKVYEEHIRTSARISFAPFFKALEPIPDEYLELMAQALTALDSDMHTPAPLEKSPLVKI